MKYIHERCAVHTILPNTIDKLELFLSYFKHLQCIQWAAGGALWLTSHIMHAYSMCVRGSHVTSVIGSDWVYLTVCLSLFCPLNLIVLFSFPFRLLNYSMSSAIQMRTFARTRLTAFFPFTLQREINDYFTFMLLAAFITLLIQSAAWFYW